MSGPGRGGLAALDPAWTPAGNHRARTRAADAVATTPLLSLVMGPPPRWLLSQTIASYGLRHRPGELAPVPTEPDPTRPRWRAAAGSGRSTIECVISPGETEN